MLHIYGYWIGLKGHSAEQEGKKIIFSVDSVVN